MKLYLTLRSKVIPNSRSNRVSKAALQLEYNIRPFIGLWLPEIVWIKTETERRTKSSLRIKFIINNCKTLQQIGQYIQIIASYTNSTWISTVLTKLSRWNWLGRNYCHLSIKNRLLTITVAPKRSGMAESAKYTYKTGRILIMYSPSMVSR